MAKNRNVPVLIKLTSRVPWWAGLLLAAIFYIGIGHLLPTILDPNYSIVLAPTFKLLSYLFSGACVLGVIAGLFQRNKQKSIHNKQESLSSIRNLSWQDFEHLIVEAFRREGYSSRLTPPGPDGGVDVVLSRSGNKYLVQCKQWKSQKVGVSPVRELAGVVAAKGANAGIFVCSGSYTREAREFAEEANVELIDGPKLAEMIGVEPISSQPPILDNAEHVCPRCGNQLVKRVAKKGANAGGQFLGCRSFPKCRYTQDLV